jgi:NADPH:quinone reductase-like Zn-dependent oxidoreductase
MDTMAALRSHVRGGPEQLIYEQAPVPVPGPGEALVAVRAAAITYAELTWDLSWTTLDGTDRTPVIPSHEFSGTVAAYGDGTVAQPAVGDDVYGLVDFDRDGAAAQYVTVPAATLAAKPRTVSHIGAAALPLSALTAWQALVDHAKLKPGETVLIHGAAGGVGVYAVQLAASLGARVIATDTGSHVADVLALGANECIDVSAERFDDALSRMGIGGVDVVLDTVGGDTLARSYRVLWRGGRLITLGAPPDEATAEQAGVQATFFVVTPDPTELAYLADLVDAGTLVPVVGTTYPLAEGRAAYEHTATPSPLGKTVLIVEGE